MGRILQLWGLLCGAFLSSTHPPNPIAHSLPSSAVRISGRGLISVGVGKRHENRARLPLRVLSVAGTEPAPREPASEVGRAAELGRCGATSEWTLEGTELEGPGHPPSPPVLQKGKSGLPCQQLSF